MQAEFLPGPMSGASVKWAPMRESGPALGPTGDQVIRGLTGGTRATVFVAYALRSHGRESMIGAAGDLLSMLAPMTVRGLLSGARARKGLTYPASGSLLVVAGSLLAAALQYTLSQRFLRDRIERVLAARPSLVAIQRAVNRNQIRLQVLLRLTPSNPATISYMLGAAGVRFAGFLLACLALVPTLAVEVYFGYAGRHVARMAGRGTQAVYLHDLIVIGGLGVTIIIMVLVSRTAHKALMEAVSGAVADPANATE